MILGGQDDDIPEDRCGKALSRGREGKSARECQVEEQMITGADETMQE